jgi:hypothetical protein
MFANSFTRRFAPALLVLLALASCSDTTPSATETQFAVQAASTTGEYAPVREMLPKDLLPGVSLSSVIGIQGGKISLAGHVLTIPAGAVTIPTLFTMTVPLNGYVEVELLATVSTVLGTVIDVGAQGFKKPVTLSLTYARAMPNVDNPSKLFIAYMKNGDYIELQKLPSWTDRNQKLVSAELDHFSKYCMASD